MSTKDLVNAIVLGDAVEIDNAFQSVMAEKISARLDDFRQQVSQRMFTTEEVNIEEEVEQIDELSKGTLASYYSKAIGDRHSKDLARDSAKRKAEPDEKEVKRLGDKIANRSSGLEKAKTKFFAKEDVEQLDEIDKLAMRGMFSADPKSKQHIGVTTEKGKAARAKANLPVLKQVIARSLGKHPKANLPEEVELDEGWIGGVSKWQSEVEKKHGDVTYKKLTQPGVTGKSTTNALKNGKIVGVYQHHNKSGTVHSVTEEAELDEEQLDELSKDTLKSYVKKASGGLKSTSRHAFDAGRAQASGDEDQADKSFKKVEKRVKGISSAVDRLTKEEVEQLVVTTVESALYAMEDGRNILDEQLDEAVSSDSKNRYESSNGKKPSGRGNWMFSTVHPREHDVTKHKDQTVSVQGTFADAAKKAASHFKDKGHKGEIHVLP